MEKKQVRLEELLPVMEQTLASGGTVRLPITGTSMLPLLVAGRDTVVLGKIDGPLQKYDLPLYRRADGAFVLHRVVAVAPDGAYTMCGDNQWVKEPGIRHSQLIGRVTRICRRGREFPVTAARYRAYCRVWALLWPVRRYLVALRGKLHR